MSWFSPLGIPVKATRTIRGVSPRAYLNLRAMIPADNITLEAERQEALKLERKRAQMEARKGRILNARTRVIGLDVAMLDKQVAEKRANADDNREADRLERLKAEEIERVLSAAMEEEKAMRAFNMEVTRKSWDEMLDAKRTQTAIDSGPDIDLNRCGMASATKFAGEDSGGMERIRAQQQQIRRWTSEQISEKNLRRSWDEEEDQQQAEIMRKIDAVREESEREEAIVKRGIRMKFAAENTAVMRARKEKEAKERADDMAAPSQNLAIVVEDKNLAMDAGGRIIRKDMFKGFTAAQNRTILMSNRGEVQNKRDREQAERDMDRDWALQTHVSLRAMEQANQEDRDTRGQRKEAHLNMLRQQIEDQARGRREWETARFGAVGEGFFQGFGTSGR